jgi:GTPase
MIKITQLQQLDSYKKLTPIQQRIAVKYKNLKEIDHCISVINNIGHEKWLRQTNTWCINKKILSDIFD